MTHLLLFVVSLEGAFSRRNDWQKICSTPTFMVNGKIHKCLSIQMIMLYDESLEAGSFCLHISTQTFPVATKFVFLSLLPIDLLH